MFLFQTQIQCYTWAHVMGKCIFLGDGLLVGLNKQGKEICLALRNFKRQFPLFSSIVGANNNSINQQKQLLIMEISGNSNSNIHFISGIIL